MRTYHCDEETMSPRSNRIAVLMTYNESPELPGVTKRYTSIGSAVLMSAFIFSANSRRPAIRHAIKILSTEETETYRRERSPLFVADGI